jgi:hypothetical protein
MGFESENPQLKKGDKSYLKIKCFSSSLCLHLMAKDKANLHPFLIGSGFYGVVVAHNVTNLAIVQF